MLRYGCAGAFFSLSLFAQQTVLKLIPVATGIFCHSNMYQFVCAAKQYSNLSRWQPGSLDCINVKRVEYVVPTGRHIDSSPSLDLPQIQLS
jgi:hypothetical protein